MPVAMVRLAMFILTMLEIEMVGEIMRMIGVRTVAVRMPEDGENSCGQQSADHEDHRCPCPSLTRYIAHQMR